MKKLTLLLLISMFWAFVNSNAQNKELTSKELFETKIKRTSEPLQFRWTDNDNLLIMEHGTENKYYKLTSANGKKEEISVDKYKELSKPVSASVFLKEGDIYFKDNVAETRLTSTPEEEKTPSLSPDGQFLAFTRNNNLYSLRLADRKEFQLTSDGSEVIMNGFASWAYMEEIFGRRTNHKAFWWSPDSKKLFFYKFNDSAVPLFTITDSPGKGGYVEQWRYPKAGDPNSEVSLFICSNQGEGMVEADFDKQKDQYFCTPYWAPDSKSIWVPWADREQKHLIIYKVDSEGGKKAEVYSEKQETWIDIDRDKIVRFLKKKDNFILSSDKSGYNHLYLYNNQGEMINPITSGTYTVLDVLYIDEKENVLYFTCYKDKLACTDFYRVGLNGKNLQRLSFGDFSHTVSLSPDAKYFVTTYSSVDKPIRLSLLTAKGKLITHLQDTELPEMEQYLWPRTELLTIKSGDGKFDLPLQVTWPEKMEKNKKYPVLIHVYGGPASIQVRNTWRNSNKYAWYAKEGLIQVMLDHRGSLHFGKLGQNYMHRRLGHYEIEDYSQCVKWLIENAQADPQKICISGFSYGGYISCYALATAPDVFTHAMAGGSVTDWMLYDAPYTERFMDHPANNPEGYKQSSVLTHACKQKGVLQLTHGNIDENVHVQNTLQLVDTLEECGKDFELTIYPASRHGYRGKKYQHYENLQVKFIYKHLLEKDVPEFLLNSF